MEVTYQNYRGELSVLYNGTQIILDDTLVTREPSPFSDHWHRTATQVDIADTEVLDSLCQKLTASPSGQVRTDSVAGEVGHIRLILRAPKEARPDPNTALANGSRVNPANYNE